MAIIIICMSQNFMSHAVAQQAKKGGIIKYVIAVASLFEHKTFSFRAVFDNFDSTTPLGCAVTSTTLTALPYQLLTY